MSVAAETRPPRRAMRCRRCDAEWSVPVGERPGSAVHCPYCEAHICGCGCGADLSEMRADAVYQSEAHTKRLKRVASADTAPTKTVADARALQEDAKAHWSMVVDEGIFRHFKADPTGTLHADDLESLGLPVEHKQGIIGSQFAKWINRNRMVECGRRASTVPSRNGAKSNLYRLTDKGRDLVVAGLDSGGTFGGSAAVESGDSPIGAGATPGGTEEGRTPTPQGTGTDQPDLFDQGPVHLTKTSAYSVENA